MVEAGDPVSVNGLSGEVVGFIGQGAFRQLKVRLDGRGEVAVHPDDVTPEPKRVQAERTD